MCTWYGLTDSNPVHQRFSCEDYLFDSGPRCFSAWATFGDFLRGKASTELRTRELIELGHKPLPRLPACILYQLDCRDSGNRARVLTVHEP